MVLIAITGELGIGKTLTLAYLAWNNWYYKKRKIFTNFTLYGIPHIKIRRLDDFFKMIPEKETEEEILSGEEKAFFGDELWRWCSSRMIGLGARERNEMINRILLASRKANTHIYYTCQLFSLIDKNIREITDLLMKPIMSADHSYTKVLVYGIIEGKYLQPMQPFYFVNEAIYAIYNTYERVADLIMNDENYEEPKEVLIPIEKNPAWKKYCKDYLGIEPDSEEFKKKCEEIEKGLRGYV